MNMRMSKQDRQGVRTATDIERKYNLGDISKNRDTGSKQDILIQQINQDLATFKAQTNAKIEELEGNDKMWFYSGVPTLENHPAVEWTTDELKAKHLGDMYYDVDNGDMYIFKFVDESYLWKSCFGSGDYDIAYNEGYGNGYAKGETDGYNNGYTDGVASVPNPLEYATYTTLMFSKATFPENYELTLNFPNTTAMGSLFSNAKNIVKATIKGNTNKNSLESASAFAGTSLVTIDLTEFCMKAKNAHNLFGSSRALQEVKGEIDLTESTANTNIALFCYELKEIRFKANSIKLSISFSHSSKLSAESVQSIIDGLATVETAQTLTLNSAIALTGEQKATIETKGWTLVQ